MHMAPVTARANFHSWGYQAPGFTTRPTLARRRGWGGNALMVLPLGVEVRGIGRGSAGTNFVCHGTGGRTTPSG